MTAEFLEEIFQRCNFLDSIFFDERKIIAIDVSAKITQKISLDRKIAKIFAKLMKAVHGGRVGMWVCGSGSSVGVGVGVRCVCVCVCVMISWDCF